MVSEISPDELVARLRESPQTILVDCRERNEADICQINGSLLISLSQWDASVEAALPDRGSTIFIYCHHGMRSQRAASDLMARGYTNVSNLTGGIDRWATDIAPTMARY